GGSCIGLAYRVPGNLRDEVLSYLRERELVTSVYLERMLDVRLGRDGKGEGVSVEAVAYIVDRRHEQYAGALDADHAARIVRGAVGQSGRNEDYVLSTLEHLEALGIPR
ncbi:MAG: gamma-glutamylcyclotransferase, partial [Mesorhizobium sp.]